MGAGKAGGGRGDEPREGRRGQAGAGLSQGEDFGALSKTRK